MNRTDLIAMRASGDYIGAYAVAYPRNARAQRQLHHRACARLHRFEHSLLVRHLPSQVVADAAADCVCLGDAAVTRGSLIQQAEDHTFARNVRVTGMPVYEARAVRA